jgi:Uma2 family endonuclease
MATLAPSETSWSAERYFELADQGVLGPDDRVELLEGVIVAMAPHTPEHASGVTRALKVVGRAIGERATSRVQLPLVAGPRYVPEPDLAIVAGDVAEYDHRHPTAALLVVEVADSSLLQDRMTKAPMYAAAGIPDYWIVNLRDDSVEIFRTPDPGRRQWGQTHTAHRGERLSLTAFPDVSVAVDDLLPAR